MVISIFISILVNTDISLSVGDSLLCQAWVLPVANDITPNNNQSLLNEAIFASYDPNDKNCSWGTQINTTQVQDGEEFIYTIRFQNTGNFPTSFVFIEDTLDYHFDISTFHVISTSHPMNYELSGQGNLKFTFNPLNLPPVSINEAESHGFVKYGIRCKQPTEVGAGITNTAYIYFDFNSPIITNTTSTQVVLPEETTLAIPHILEGDIPIGWIIYPNPAQTILHIDFDENAAIEGNILLMDYTGKLLLTQAIHDENVILALNNFTKGLYLCVLTDKKGRYLATIKVVLNP